MPLELPREAVGKAAQEIVQIYGGNAISEKTDVLIIDLNLDQLEAQRVAPSRSDHAASRWRVPGKLRNLRLPERKGLTSAALAHCYNCIYVHT